MTAPSSRRLLSPAGTPPRSKKARKTKAFIAELRRQCRLVAEADRRDPGWKKRVRLS